ncbi:MAG TPA: hypothetical protein VGM49_00410 [Candidatus Limnocylindrales bacterium]|jgi:hypothetical protein
MTDPLDRVLKLVAEGRLTAEEAAPILDALDSRGKPPVWAPFAADPGPTSAGSASTPPPTANQQPRWARIEVRENGRRVVDLRIPISLGRFALARVPGLSKEQIADVEQAVSTGTHGPILDVQDVDGDGVRIVLE